MHGGWRPGVLGRAEAEVIEDAEVFEDLLDGYLVVEVGNDLVELTRLRRQSRYAATLAAACCLSKSMGLT